MTCVAPSASSRELMAGPSAAHEERVGALETLAALAGFSASADLGPGLIPDVVRLDAARRRLFIGDAKATESSRCTATRTRLASYLSEARLWRLAGADVLFTLAHGAPARADRWLNTVEAVLADAGLDVAAVGSAGIGPDCVLAWAWIGRLAAQSHPAGMALSGQGLR